MWRPARQRAVNLLNGKCLFLAAFALKVMVHSPGSVVYIFNGLVNVTVGVAGDGDRLLPVADNGFNGVDDYRRAKNRAVKDGADSAVGLFHISVSWGYSPYLTFG